MKSLILFNCYIPGSGHILIPLEAKQRNSNLEILELFEPSFKQEEGHIGREWGKRERLCVGNFDSQ